MPLIAPHLTPRVHKQPAADHLVAKALRIADRAVLADIKSEAARAGADGAYDVRPMLDARERSGPAIDMASDALAYALDRGLVVQAGEPWLVRIVAKP